MDTRWLQDFVTLAEVRNFTRAAELRAVSQAAFSRRIQALEQWLGAKLIDRASFPTRMTKAGERFRVVAIALIDQIDDAKTEIGDAPSRDHVRLAMPYSLTTTRLRRGGRRGAATSDQLQPRRRQRARHGDGADRRRGRPADLLPPVGASDPDR